MIVSDFRDGMRMLEGFSDRLNAGAIVAFVPYRTKLAGLIVAIIS